MHCQVVALTLETLQPSFSCRASNSQRRDGEPVAEQNRERRVKQEKAEQNRLFSVSSTPQVTSFFFFFLHVRDKASKKQILQVSAFLTNLE